MAEKKFAFELAAGLATQVLTQSKYVKGSYIIVKDVAERDALTVCTGTGENDGVIVPGSLVYVTANKKSYRYNGTDYEEVKAAAVSSFNYKGEVENYSNLPVKPDFGDIYKVNKRTVEGVEVNDGHTYFANRCASVNVLEEVLSVDQELAVIRSEVQAALLNYDYFVSTRHPGPAQSCIICSDNPVLISYSSTGYGTSVYALKDNEGFKVLSVRSTPKSITITRTGIEVPIDGKTYIRYDLTPTDAIYYMSTTDAFNFANYEVLLFHDDGTTTTLPTKQRTLEVTETGIEWALVSGTDDVVDLTEIETAIGKDTEGNLVKVTDRIKDEAADADYSSETVTLYAWKPLSGQGLDSVCVYTLEDEVGKPDVGTPLYKETGEAFTYGEKFSGTALNIGDIGTPKTYYSTVDAYGIEICYKETPDMGGTWTLCLRDETKDKVIDKTISIKQKIESLETEVQTAITENLGPIKEAIGTDDDDNLIKVTDRIKDEAVNANYVGTVQEAVIKPGNSFKCNFWSAEGASQTSFYVGTITAIKSGGAATINPEVPVVINGDVHLALQKYMGMYTNLNIIKEDGTTIYYSLNGQADNFEITFDNEDGNTVILRADPTDDGYGTAEDRQYLIVDEDSPASLKVVKKTANALTIKEKIESLESAIESKEELYTNSAATTATIGGIAKGSTFNNKTMKEMWDMLLYPYVPFELTSFIIRGTLPDGTTKAASGSYEWGTVINDIKEVSYASIKLGSKTTGGTAELKSRVGSTGDYSPAWSSTNAMEDYEGFHNCSQYVNKWSGDNTLEYVFTISDGSTTVNLTNKFTPVKYIYHVTSNQNSGLSPVLVASERGNESTITLSGTDKYIWFFCPDRNKIQIQQYAVGQWNDMTTTYQGTCTVTLPTGVEVTYYAYVGPEMTAGTGKYRIN